MTRASPARKLDCGAWVSINTLIRCQGAFLYTGIRLHGSEYRGLVSMLLYEQIGRPVDVNFVCHDASSSRASQIHPGPLID